MIREKLIKQYIKWGLAVIPVSASSKIPTVEWKGYQNKRPTNRTIRDWFNGKKRTHPGAVMGKASGNVFRLDFDNIADFEPVMNLGVIPASAPVCKTPHGRAILLKSIDIPQTIRQRKIPGYPKLEIQGQGAIGVLPDTTGYEWLNELPEEIPCIGDFKSWFASAFPTKQQPVSTLTPEERDNRLPKIMNEAGIGGRHAAIVSAVSLLKARRCGYATIRMFLQPFVDKWKLQDPPYTQEEFEKDFKDVFNRYNPIEPKGLPPRAQFSSLGQARKGIIKRTPLIDGLLMPKQKIVLVGWEGTGKSTLAINITVEAALGLPIFGKYPVARPLKTAYMDMEIGKEGTINFFDHVTAGRGNPPDEMIGLFHCRERGSEVKVNVTERALLNATRDAIIEFDPDILILDGWYLFVSENDQDQVKAAFDFLDDVRENANCSVIICHHTKKVGAPIFTPRNIFELASGWGLMRWAETKLAYMPVAGMPNMAILNGKTRIPEWNPISVLLEYIPEYMLLEARDENEFLSDAQLDVVFPLGRVNRRTAVANTIRLMTHVQEIGMKQSDIAELVGVSQAIVSQWIAGKKIPSKEHQKVLTQKLAEIEVEASKDELEDII
jgi:predicted XRE-type DNA-binding protein